MAGLCRIGDGPIITPETCPSLGDNINGASLIRAPDFFERPLGRYYLYFAHHKGRHIRLAVADTLEGPWRIHTPGVMPVEGSGFATRDIDPADLDDAQMGPWRAATGGSFLYAHVASPDVHVDHDAGLVRMYYHGLCPDGEQLTRLAVSGDGLAFTPASDVLGPPYFRAFTHGGHIYAVAWGGGLYRAMDWGGPFERGPDIFVGSPLHPEGTKMRHAAMRCQGDELTVWFTRIGDCPERIVAVHLSLSADWHDWRINEVTECLRPVHAWEGADMPLLPSQTGAADGREFGLRDPCYFADNGREFLLYAVAGESGLAMAALACPQASAAASQSGK